MAILKSDNPIHHPSNICRLSRRNILRAGMGAVLTLSGFTLRSAELDIANRYSPKNQRRPRRPHTGYIVLHTTEGSEAGSLAKIQSRGEANYFVGSSGNIYRIIDKGKIAMHAGRSMWQGHGAIDNYSIGIEVVGRHDRDITASQYAALRSLLYQLKATYKIPDENVLTHSMVAYGRPNHFHRYNHRGRKRCGMIFAQPDVRRRLGLASKPERDVDVEHGRLQVGDPELYHFLFARASAIKPRPGPGEPAKAVEDLETPVESSIISRNWSAWHIARERYDDSKTIYIFPSGKRIAGNQIKNWDNLPVGTKVQTEETDESQGFEGFWEIGKDGDTAQDLAGGDYARRTTIYFFPDGMIRTGMELEKKRTMRHLLANLPKGTRVLAGYFYGGYVKSKRLPSSIAGVKWNYPSTFYRLPDGKIFSGDEIDATAIPAGTLVFYQN
jgi:N-acetylmuramoyl-L-alanine amidase